METAVTHNGRQSVFRRLVLQGYALVGRFVRVWTDPTLRRLATYQSDRFFFWQWCWQWQWQARQQRWEVVKLRAYCPVCQAKLVGIRTPLGLHLRCPSGELDHGVLNTEDDNAKLVRGLILEKAARQFDLTHP